MLKPASRSLPTASAAMSAGRAPHVAGTARRGALILNLTLTQALAMALTMTMTLRLDLILTFVLMLDAEPDFHS